MEEIDGGIECEKESSEKTVESSDLNIEKSKHATHEDKNDSIKENFKKPMLFIGPRRGLPTKVKVIPQNIATEVFTKPEEESKSDIKTELLLTVEKLEKSDALQQPLTEKKIALPYIEPSWNGIPEDTYKLEILKSGVILETIDLSKKSYHVVGRLPSCDISMAHPTISRYHAIFQYRQVGDEKNGKSLYIYDLESTHGTFWNGNRIRPKVYVRLHGGHMIRFGCSQRKFIVQTPLSDEEQESELTVTQLKEMRRLELEEREKLEKQRQLEKEEEERLRKEKEENEGIDWGMGEDADEETDLTENPYAQTNNEELFLDDPKKTLRGWFEREGYDLQYQTEDKGIGKYLCWVDLPIDTSAGKTVRAEALVSGKKKEAVIQCALEACRTLDRYGLLRQANHEARKRKTRNWEEEDYYDSDEDNFLDRTGAVEKKREQRMRLAGKLETKAETYDSLLEKHSKVAEKITNLENTIALHKLKQDATDDSNEDALDAFMSSLGTAALDKSEVRRMKIDLLNLRKEEMQLLKLINIAKPANLPPLKPHVANIAKKSKDDFKDLKSVIGHKKKTKSLQKSKDSLKLKEMEIKEGTVLSEDEDLIDPLKEKLKEECKNLVQEETQIEVSEQYDKIDEYTEPSLQTEDKESTIDDGNEKCETENNINLKKKKKKNTKRNHQRKELQKDYDKEEFREDYSMWVPPENQSGDGKTNLNEKFGY